MSGQMFPMVAKQALVRRRGKVLVGPVDLTLNGQGTSIVIGPNGAGKTTLLKMLHGIVRMNGGALDWGCSSRGGAAAAGLCVSGADHDAALGGG